VDGTPPEPFQLLSPEDSAWTADRRPTFSWTPSTDSGSLLEEYQLYIDGSLAEDNIDPGTTSLELSYNLPDGSHEWYVMAIDSAGNTRQSEQTWTVRVDNTGPNSFSLVSPANYVWTSDSTETFVWTATSDGGIGLSAYELNVEITYGGSYRAIQVHKDSTRYTLKESEALSHGNHRWYVRAIDLLGNDTQTSSRTLRVDLEPPVPFNLSTPADSDYVTFPTPNFSWENSSDAGSGLSHYQLWIDDQLNVDNVTTTTTAPSAPISEGPHSWFVRAIDNVGNARRSSEIRTVFGDWNSPEPFDLVSPADGDTVNERSPIFVWQRSHDSGTGVRKYQLWINGVLNRDNIPAADTTTTPAEPLADGDYTWFVKVFDGAGNSRSSTSIWSFTVYFIDNIAPEVFVISPNGGETLYTEETYELAWIVNDNVGLSDIALYYSIDSGNNWMLIDSSGALATAESYEWTIPNSPSQNCLFRVWASDSSNNRSYDDSDSFFTIADRIGPYVEVSRPQTGMRYLAGSQDTVRWIAKDNVGVVSLSVEFSSDGRESWSQISEVSPEDSLLLWSVPLINSQDCWVRARAWDADGNLGADSSGVFTINRPPLIIDLPDTSVLEDEPFSMLVVVQNVDPGDSLTFFDDSPMFQIGTETGEILFTPDNGDVGQHRILVWVSDGLDSDSTDFLLTVENVNDAPNVFSLISPTNGAMIDTLNPYLTWQEATDVDVGDSVWYVVRISADSLMSSPIREETVVNPHWRVDGGLEPNSQYFWDVCAIDRDSAVTFCQKVFRFNTSSTATGVVQEGNVFAPKDFILHQNYPNPFPLTPGWAGRQTGCRTGNSRTTIRYQLPKPSKVTIKIFNLFGQEIRTLVSEEKQAGYFTVHWDGKDSFGREVASGVYIYRIEACTDKQRSFVSTRKMLLLR